ncbi:MAG: autotransporter domain-containing protein, partial [Planctomycetaceae bacterium]|nr:autotransporter domain-containing protein [Planctomycetaceae bacterium]
MNATGGVTERPFFSEVELAILKDVGNTSIKLEDHFGRSIYQYGTGTITNGTGTITNSTDWSSKNNKMYAVGLHVVGGGEPIRNAAGEVTGHRTGYTINNTADLSANGFAGAGIRIEGNNNTVRVRSNSTVSANGQDGIGVLVIWGTGNTIINNGTISATGQNGIGVYLDAEINEFIHRGTINVDKSNGGIHIHHGPNDRQAIVNMVRGGSFQNNGNPTTPRIRNQNGNVSLTLTMGKLFDSNDNLIGGDSAFNMTFGNDTEFDGLIDVETWGGITTFNMSTLNLNQGIVGSGTVASTLNLPGTVSFSTLQLGSAANTASVLDGQTTGKVTVASGVENRISVKNLASFAAAFINNFGIIENNTLVKTDGSFWDTDMSVGIKNNAGAIIRNNTTIESEWGLRNLSNIDNNGTINVNWDIDNVAGAAISNTTALLKGWNLSNAGNILTTAKMEMLNIGNTGLIDNTWNMNVIGNVVNGVTGVITNTGTMNVGNDLDNAGVVNRFTTINVGNDLFNRAGGFIDAAKMSTVNVARNGNNWGLFTVNGEANFGGIFTNEDGLVQGKITGTGQIATIGGFVNEGIIAPGNSIGTLTVAGPFTNNPTGRFEIEVDPSHYPNQPIAGFHNDLVNVIDNPATVLKDGAATVNGGLVDVDAPSNDKTKNAAPARYVGNTKYTFLDTEDGLTVNAKITAVNPPDLLLFDFLADTDYTKSYWLDVQRHYYYGPFGDTFNQIAVGNYLDDIGLDPDPLGDFFDVLVALDKLNAGIPHRAGISRAAKFAEDQMSGAIYGTLAQSSITNTTIVNNTLNDVLRRDAFGGKASSCDPCDMIIRSSGKSFNRNTWGLGFGTSGNTEHDGNAYGYDQSFGGTIVGVDRTSKRTRTGAYASYGEGRITSNLLDRSKSKEFLAGIYFRKEMNIGYALLSGGLGYNEYDTERTISFVNRRTKNEHNAFVGTVYAERGLEFKMKKAKVQPFFGLQYVGNQQDSFTETGADSLNLLG